MAQGVHGNAGQGIEVLLAIDIPNAATLTALERDGQAPISVHGVRRSGFNESRHAKTPVQIKSGPTKRAVET